MIRIVVPGDLWDTSPNHRIRPPAAKRKLQRLSREAAQWSWVAAGKPRFDVPIRYTIVYRRAAELDDDNAIAAAKWMRDGLFVGALTPSDGSRWVKLAGVEFERSTRPEVEFRVEAR